MSIKGYFFFLPILFLTAFLSHAQETGLYPLSQYSVGAKSNEQLRTTTTTVQQDTLKIPYIEDFSGKGIPVESITVKTYSGSVLVYQIKHLKMHGLKNGANIRIYLPATKDIIASKELTGTFKYAKVLDKYTFQLFNDVALTIPTKVEGGSGRIHYLNWLPIGVEGYSSSPDTLGFLNNQGGVYINNDMALNPISIGVATFDGVNYKGIPYSTTTKKGYADNLTSLPFNLSQYGTKDSIYMSFYWQSKSLGDSPLSAEFLSLEFKDTSKTDTWIEVWRKQGNSTTVDTFMVAMVSIRDSAYLHKGFQYRFRSYGVLNGRFNVWNLDYIYINTKRDPLKPLLKDISIITTSRCALKNYTSVPYTHIKSLSVALITIETDTAFMTIRDSYNDYSDFNSIPPIERKHLIRDNLNPFPADTIKFENNPAIHGDPKDPKYNPKYNQQYKFPTPFIDIIPGGLMTKPYVLKEEFFYPPIDTMPIDMTFNNFAAIETYFYESYSYDDGTPELAFLSINPGGTKVANAFKILKADGLTHIDYCFIRNNGVDMTNTSIFLNVWKRDSTTGIGPMDPIKLISLRQQQISIKYSSDINGFVRYQLSTPLPLDSGTYYFGFSQNVLNPLFLGYDRNNDRLKKIFFCNDGINWHPFTDNSSVTGSLMIRPVFSYNEIITSNKNQEIKETQFTFYPNPAKDELHFTGQPEYISIYDLSGLLLLEKKMEGTEVLSTETLTNGLYLIILSQRDYKEVKRLIIQK